MDRHYRQRWVNFRSASTDYSLGQGYALSIEYTDDPHPRNVYWEMYGNPMFDLKDAAAILLEINACRKTFPNHYVRVIAFDSSRGWETPRMSYLVNRPAKEPGFGLAREEAEGRSIRYRISSYSTDRPENERY